MVKTEFGALGLEHYRHMSTGTEPPAGNWPYALPQRGPNNYALSKFYSMASLLWKFLSC